MRTPRWPLLFAALALVLGYFWVYRLPEVAMVGMNYYSDFCLGSVLFCLFVAARGAQLLVGNWCASRLGVNPGAFPSRRLWPWLLAITAGTYLMVAFELPLRVSFSLSRSALDRIADEALADPDNAHRLAGRLAGLYQIAGVEVIGKTVVLYLGKNGGSYGFVRVPRATTDVIYNRPRSENDPQNHRDFPRDEGFPDPKGSRIRGDWFVMYSSYWRVKVGWS